jgi:hypothetical protein
MSVQKRTIGSSSSILGSGYEPFLAGRLPIKVNARLRSGVNPFFRTPKRATSHVGVL